MAEICQSGYTDALRFLQENSKDHSSYSCEQKCFLCGSTLNVIADLISFEMDAAKPACCELVKEAEESTENAQQNRLKPQLLESLPVNIEKGKDSGAAGAPQEKKGKSFRSLDWKLNLDFCVSVV